MRTNRSLGWVTLAMLGLGYFVLFPEDLSGILAPVEKVLGLSRSVSPWLYGLIGVAVVAWTVIRVWGTRESQACDREAVSNPVG